MFIVSCLQFYWFFLFTVSVEFRVADPHHIDADPDPACHLTDPDPAFHFYADPDSPDHAHHFFYCCIYTTDLTVFKIKCRNLDNF
jgi:hypothetical protein